MTPHSICFTIQGKMSVTNAYTAHQYVTDLKEHLKSPFAWAQTNLEASVEGAKKQHLTGKQPPRNTNLELVNTLLPISRACHPNQIQLLLSHYANTWTKLPSIYWHDWTELLRRVNTLFIYTPGLITIIICTPGSDIIILIVMYTPGSDISVATYTPDSAISIIFIIYTAGSASVAYLQGSTADLHGLAEGSSSPCTALHGHAEGYSLQSSTEVPEGTLRSTACSLVANLLTGSSEGPLRSFIAGLQTTCSP
ncbi:hypothetical protein CRENBAI_010274 [Crenichthys baileyi]|uniref:Uncharacterized protein n=1 Tax=Crenichthys baileyi TaxID=28760 RepID=A0AAV9SLF6_9TELE